MLAGWRLLQINSAKIEEINNNQNLQILKIGQTEVRVEIVATAEERGVGLGGRESLAEYEGMLFVFEEPGVYGFWMKGMKFGLDFIWISQSRVVEVAQDVRPPVADYVPEVYQPKQPIEAMLEVNAGWVKRNNVKIGDEVVY